MAALVLVLANLLFPLAVIAVLINFIISPRRRVLLGIGAELKERLGFLSVQQVQKLSGRPVIWVHAASAGEVSAVSGLLPKIRALSPECALLMTTSTATGRQAARELPNVDVAAMAPLDFYPTVDHFLRFITPKALILVETELWPHMIELNFRHGAKLCLINGRLTEKSFSRYRPMAPFVKPFLSRFSRLIVQTGLDKQRFLALGALEETLIVAGNIKYDVTKGGATSPHVPTALHKLGWDGFPIFVAGSTHPVEEETLLDAFLEARAACPQLKLIIAPRHVERAAQTAATLKTKGLRFALWTQPLDGSDHSVLLIDAMGILPACYPHARVSFVGGTLVPVGGHNLLEPALAGSPVLFGRHVSHTADTAAILKKTGGGFQVNDKNDLARLLIEILSDSEKAETQ